MIIIFMLTCCLSLTGQVIFSEIMFNPPGSDSPNEFIELFNQSDSTLDLSQWIIADRAAGDILIPDSLNPGPLLPGRHALIIEGDYDNQLYVDLLPDSVARYRTATSTIGNGLGNSGDSLWLRDADSILVAVTGWSAAVPAGYSRERIRYHRPDAPGNWSASLDSLGTPGLPNSVRPHQVDGAVVAGSLRFDPPIIAAGETTSLHFAVANRGLAAFSGSAQVYRAGDWYNSLPLPELAELDTMAFSLPVMDSTSGVNRWLVQLLVDGDGNPGNNCDSTILKVRFMSGAVTINEFLPRPLTPQVEFVEVTNHLAYPVNLAEWSLRDAGSSYYRLPAIVAAPGQLVVIAADTSLKFHLPDPTGLICPLNGWPTLNNDYDQIRIYDPCLTIIDSLSYSPAWGAVAGYSLEKRLPGLASADPANWAAARNDAGMTPGQPNSIMPHNIDVGIVPNSITHNPRFPENSQTVDYHLQIINSGLTAATPYLQLAIDSQPYREYSVITVNPGDSLDVSLELPAFTSGFHHLQFTVAAPGDSNSANDSAGDTLVVSYPSGAVRINEFHCQPATGFTEYIELDATHISDCGGWGFSDQNTSAVGLPSISLVEKSFLVLAADSQLHAPIPAGAPLLIPSTWPTLNNSDDCIYIYDPTGKIIDSLCYSADWDIEAGRSMEKLRTSLVSNDPDNWAPAVNPAAGTPGTANSICPADTTGAGYLHCKPNPFSPDGDGRDDRLHIHYRVPFDLPAVRVEIFDLLGRRIAAPAWNTPAAREGIIIWDGRRKNGDPARTGVYLVKFTATNGGRRWEKIESIVIARN